MAYRRTENVVRRLAARHDAIIAAARGGRGEGGMAAVQIAPVAARAGIAAGTVYRYFPAKTDLVGALVASMSEREIGAVRRAGRCRARAAVGAGRRDRDLRRARAAQPAARLGGDRRAGRRRDRRGAARAIARRSPRSSQARIARRDRRPAICRSRTRRLRRRRWSARCSKG